LLLDCRAVPSLRSLFAQRRSGSSVPSHDMIKHDNDNWFAVYVRPRHEKRVQYLFEQKGLSSFLPLYKLRKRWADRMKEVEFPLFPQYLFCQLDENRKLPVLSTPGVLRIVGDGSKPVPVDPEELEAIRRVVEAGLSCDPISSWREGMPVHVVAGPLAGVTGTLVHVKQTTGLVLSISLLRRSVLVHMDQDCVAPMAPTQFFAPGASARGR
jgi:transcription antitermination factor NusG